MNKDVPTIPTRNKCIATSSFLLLATSSFLLLVAMHLATGSVLVTSIYIYMRGDHGCDASRF